MSEAKERVRQIKRECNAPKSMLIERLRELENAGASKAAGTVSGQAG